MPDRRDESGSARQAPGQVSEPTQGIATADIIVFCTFALRSIILELAAPFQRATGNGIRFELDSTPRVKARIADAEPADVILIARSIADELAHDGHLDPARIHDVARSGVGVAIRSGAPRPDIATPEALKRMLLGAGTVVYTDPASGGASGVHFAAILDKLGIADEMKPKSKLNVGSYNSDLVARGEGDVAIQQIAEILPVEGVELLGPLPDELQIFTVFVAAIGSLAKEPGAAQELVAFLKSEAARGTIERNGMTQL